MFTATEGLILPSTTTGSFPRPRWFDVSMWGRPLDTCMLDVRFREKFQDAMAVLIGDQERAGLDVLTHGDLHVDEDLAGRAWHHYPLQRWAGFEGDHLQPEETTAPWLHYPPGTLLNEIYTGWRWPHVVGQDRAPAARLSQNLAHRAGKDAQTAQVRHLLLPGDGPFSRYPYASVPGQAPGHLGHGGGHEQRAVGVARGRLPLHADRRAHLSLHGQHLRQGSRRGEVHDRCLQPRGPGPRRRGDLDSHLLGQPQHAARDGGYQLRQLDRDLSGALPGRCLDAWR